MIVTSRTSGFERPQVLTRIHQKNRKGVVMQSRPVIAVPSGHHLDHPVLRLHFPLRIHQGALQLGRAAQTADVGEIRTELRPGSSHLVTSQALPLAFEHRASANGIAGGDSRLPRAASQRRYATIRAACTVE